LSRQNLLLKVKTFQQQIFENNPFHLMIFNVSVFVDTTVLFSIIFCVDLAVYEEQDVR